MKILLIKLLAKKSIKISKLNLKMIKKLTEQKILFYEKSLLVRIKKRKLKKMRKIILKICLKFRINFPLFQQ